MRSNLEGLALVLGAVSMLGCASSVSWTITSEPPGAEVCIGTTPENLECTGDATPHTEVNSGGLGTFAVWWNDAYVQLHKPGYAPTEARFVPGGRSSRTTHFVLQPNKPQESKPPTRNESADQRLGYGYLKLTSNEQNVDIYVDGDLAGQIQEGPFNKKLPAGPHRIMARKSYFMPITIRASVEVKSVFAYRFELVEASGWTEAEPGVAKVVQARGNLTVVTERSDYVVYFEGVRKTPPFELKGIPAGLYELRIVRTGLDESITIEVNDGDTVFLDLDERFSK